MQAARWLSRPAGPHQRRVALAHHLADGPAAGDLAGAVDSQRAETDRRPDARHLVIAAVALVHALAAVKVNREP